VIVRTAQRLVWALVAGAPTAAAGQAEAAAQLWRLAATTLPVPPALADGGPGAFWNPAQRLREGRVLAGLDVVQAPTEVGASGLVATIHVGLPPVGYVGLIYGRMQVNDLVRTTVSPDPQPGGIPYFAHALGLTWTRAVAGTAVGATLALHEHRVDVEISRRWTLDVGVARRIGEALRLAAATHFLSPEGGPAARDVYGAIGCRLWRGEPWRGGGQARLELRYGVALAHGFPADHLAGLGFEVGEVFGADFLVAREGGYAEPGWRPVGGLRLAVGRYRVTVARDAGVGDLGAAFRVGLEAWLDD
jgi:hypothetical protein